MDEELEKDIDRKKREISDYMKVAKVLHFEDEVINKRVDMLLEDLNKLLKKRK